MSVCSISGCGSRVNARGWCHKHYDRWRRYGDPLSVRLIYGNALARFWSKVDKTPACWLWTGTILSNGRAQFYCDGRGHPASRWIFQHLHGELSSDEYVCHHCDNPACVRPDHLYKGTAQTNVRDREDRHPVPKGTRHPNAKLSQVQVSEIRRRYAAGTESQQQLADEFGVHQTRVSSVVRGERYR